MLVDNISELIKNHKNWLEILTTLISKIEKRETENVDGEIIFLNIIDSLENSDNYAYHTDRYEPSYETISFIEYIYIIDLDSLKFIIIPQDRDYYNSKVFKLTEIPKDWIKICTVNDTDSESEDNTNINSTEKLVEVDVKDDVKEKVEDDVKEDKYDMMLCMMQKMMVKIETIENMIKIQK
jgi:hypothetical protein